MDSTKKSYLKILNNLLFEHASPKLFGFGVIRKNNETILIVYKNNYKHFKNIWNKYNLK